MSNIPNSAMPHAGSTNDNDDQKEGRRASVKKGAAKLKDKARDNPKTAIAAGAAIVAGAVAAAAVPVVRARKKKAAGSKSADADGDRREGETAS